MPVLQLMMGKGLLGTINHTVSWVLTVAGSPSGTPTPATETYTASPVNGVGPFTYLWTQVSGTGVTLTNTTLPAGTITTNNGLPQLRVGMIRCTITDTGNGGYSAFADIAYSLEVI